MPESFEIYDIDERLNDLEKSELAKHVEPIDKTKEDPAVQRKRKQPTHSQLSIKFPEVPANDLVDIIVDCNNPSTSKKSSLAKPLPNRRKRLLSGPPLSIEQCTKFIQKLSKSFESLKSKFDKVKNFKGNALQEVKKHVHKQFKKLKNSKYGGHLKKLGGGTQIAATGLMVGMLMEDLLKGKFDRVALNVGFFIVAYASTKLSEKAAIYGSNLVAKGRLKAGWLLKAAGPFLHSIGTTVMVYEFYKSVRDLNMYDSDTIANVVANGILLGVELFEFGIFLMVSAGWLAGSSSVVVAAGPIGIAVVIIVFVGLRIYQVVKEVEKIKEKVQMSGWEMIRDGSKRFFTGSGLQHIQKIYEEISANENLRDMAIEALNKTDNLEMFFLPSAVLKNGQIEFAEKRLIDLRRKGFIAYSRSAPGKKGHYETVCLPKDVDGDRLWKFDYRCENAFGVRDKTSKHKTAMHFELIKGIDHVFAKNATNTYSIGDGFKDINGNDGHDIFILNGETTNGKLDGKGGYDVILAQNFHKKVVVNFDVKADDLYINHFDKIHNKRQNILAKSVEDIRGRPDKSDSITIPCDINYVNANGGQNMIRGRDMIFIKNGCSYNVTISIGQNSVVKSAATIGRFIYQLTNITGSSFIYLKKGSFQNIFVFDYAIDELIDLKKLQPNFVLMVFKDNFNPVNVAKVSIKNYDNQTVFAFKENVVLRLGDSNAYLTTVSNISIAEISWKYMNVIYEQGLILKAKSNSDGSVVVMGHGRKAFGVNEKDSKNVLSNDDKVKTIIYPGTVKNVFLIVTDEQLYNNSIHSINDFYVPPVLIRYDQIPNEVDEIDISVLAHKLRQAFGLNLFVEAIADPLGLDIKLRLHAIDSSDKKIKSIGEIILLTALLTGAYKNIIIAHKSGFWIKLEYPEDKKSGTILITLEPIPLSFDGNKHDIFVISEDDVSYGNIVEINKDLEDFHYLSSNDTLVITNAAVEGIKADKMLSVLVHNFFKSELMQSIDLTFKDIYVPLKASLHVHGLMDIPGSSDLLNHFYKNSINR